jgi:NAD(P)-dependent dehydrogenase (short-subunit alcohol dehydrogenase family)
MIAETFSMPLDDLKTIMAINVEGTFLGMKHLIPRIAKSGGGAVINISSLAGLKGIAGMTAYCGSKGAIRMMTRAVALECAALRNKVRVNSVTESKKLIALRDKLVQLRRVAVERFQTIIAEKLDGDDITRIQKTIDAVDRAIADEVLVESKVRV